MKHLSKYINEGIFDNNVKSELVPEKLAKVLKKFFGEKVSLCEDHQGIHTWYEVNYMAVPIKITKVLLDRIYKYCSKIKELDIKIDKLPNFGIVRNYVIGNDDYYIILNLYGQKIEVSEEFYKCGILPHNQTGVVKRGWDEWQRN